MGEQFVTFTLDGSLYGVDVRRVQEALRPQTRTPVPLAPGAVAGLVNLRGQVVMAVDLRERLGLPPLPQGEAMVVVVQVAGESISLLVDSIGDVVEVSQELFEPPPETLDPALGELILGAYKLPDRLLLALDVDRATTT